MNLRRNFKFTILASYIGYVTQAIIINFAPLLFLTFKSSYGITLELIGLLVTINFVTQITVDILAARFVDKIGYRAPVVTAHVLCAAGLVGLAVFPEISPNPYIGIVLATVTYAIGGGLIEVLISPIVEACPSDSKASAMSLLHSFYCWGSVLVVLVSTLLFSVLGIESWKLVAIIWAIVPFVNIFLFAFVPISTLAETGRSMTLGELVRTKTFWFLAIIMLGGGASELSMSQWASAFAESGLGVSKAVGDLLGPCLFAVCMGAARVFHAKVGDRFDLEKFLCASAVLCIFSYILVCLSPIPIISLIGCGICGLSVAVMWPGTFSYAGIRCPRGGASMFAMLAFAGDVGCSAGPTLVGYVSGAIGGNLKLGLLSALVFPILILIGIALVRSQSKKESAKN